MTLVIIGLYAIGSLLISTSVAYAFWIRIRRLEFQQDISELFNSIVENSSDGNRHNGADGSADKFNEKSRDYLDPGVDSFLDFLAWCYYHVPEHSVSTFLAFAVSGSSESPPPRFKSDDPAVNSLLRQAVHCLEHRIYHFLFCDSVLGVAMMQFARLSLGVYLWTTWTKTRAGGLILAMESSISRGAVSSGI